MKPVDKSPSVIRRGNVTYVVAFALFASFVIGLFVPTGITNVYFISAALGVTMAAAVVMGRRRLVVDSERISAGSRSIAWSDVAHYRYVSVGPSKGSTPLGSWLLDQTRGTRYRTLQIGRLTLHGRDGQTLAIGNAWHNPHEALDLAFTQLHSRLDPLARGAVAPFAFLPHALAHPDGELVYEDIERVELTHGRLNFYQRGRSPWVSEPMKNINNVLLLVAQFARRGIDVVVDTNVFLPPSLLSQVVPPSGAPPSIPSATLVR